MTAIMIELVLLAVLVGSLLLSWRAGAAIGRRVLRDRDAHPQLGVVQGAILALLGLLLGFCFSGSMSRFIERQDLIVAEANAIGTIALRADLAGSSRVLMLSATGAFAAARVKVAEAAQTPGEPAAATQLAEAQSRLWAATAEAARGEPAMALALVQPVNELIDLQTTRAMAARRHVPVLVMVIVFACALFGMATVGLGTPATAPALRAPAVVLVLLIAATLWTIVDLDFPRLGLVQVDTGPLREASAAVEARLVEVRGGVRPG